MVVTALLVFVKISPYLSGPMVVFPDNRPQDSAPLHEILSIEVLLLNKTHALSNVQECWPITEVPDS
jgi:hypothetical protein